MPVLPRKVRYALLPAAAKTPDLTEDALRTSQYLIEEAAAAMQADKNLTVILPAEIQRVFPEIRDSGDYEFLDHFRFRSALGVDAVLITAVFKPYENIERTTYKISAYSGRVLDGRRAAGTGSPTFQFRERTPGHFIRFLVSSYPAERTAGACMDCDAECSRCNGRKCMLNFGFEADLDQISEDLADEWDSAERSSFASGFRYAGPADAGTFLEKPDASLPYFLHMPPEFQKTGWGYPLLIYLHGTRAHNETLSSKLISESPLSVLYALKNGEHSLDLSRLPLLNQYLKSSFVLLPQVSLSRLKDDPEELKLLTELNKLVVELHTPSIRRASTLQA